MNSLKKTKIFSLRPVIFFILSQTFYSQAGLANLFQADESVGQIAYGGSSDSPTVDEIKKLEQFLGFNSEKKKSELDLKTSEKNSLLDQPNAQGVQPNAAAVLEDAAAKSLWSIFSANSNQLTFIPDSLNNPSPIVQQLASTINALANILFQTVLPVSKSFDAPPGPGDKGSPVTQSVLNILSLTPSGFSMTNPYTDSRLAIKALGLNKFEGTNWTDIQNYFQGTSDNPDLNIANLIYPSTGNTGGANPNPQTHILNQVDSSVFLSPLMYNDQDTKKDGATQCLGITCGLDEKDTNQLHNAVNFVRHVTGMVLPPDLPKSTELRPMFESLNDLTKEANQQNLVYLSKFIVGTRVYAARQSVGIQNIYEILARRIPNNTGSSQALSEFIMATYRLFTPTSNQATSWQNKINEASSTTVQKETALLLAEINYQLYLMRQQQERMVLTNSLLLVSNLQYPRLQGTGAE